MGAMMRVGVFRGVRLVVLGLLGFALLLVGEVMLAFRVERIDGFTPEQLDGTIGQAPVIRAVWIGDSTTAGVGASGPGRTLPHLVASSIGRGVELRVLGVSGATVRDALETQVGQLEAGADVVFVSIGNNDVTHLSSRARVRRELHALLDAIAATKPSEIVVLGVANFGGSPLLRQPLRFFAGVRAHQLDTEVRQVARTFGATFVPVADLTHDGFAADPLGTHALDRFHPSDAGYQLWADAVTTTMEITGVMERLRKR